MFTGEEFDNKTEYKRLKTLFTGKTYFILLFAVDFFSLQSSKFEIMLCQTQIINTSIFKKSSVNVTLFREIFVNLKIKFEYS